jgi:hypothetical protein
MMRLQCNRQGNTFGVALLLAATVAVTTTRAAFINLTPTSGSANSSTSVKLSDLIAGTNGIDGITVGDKQMNGFVYSPIGDMPPATSVEVLGYQDPSGNWGLSFQGTFMDLPGGGVSDAMIRFVVNIDPNFLRQGYRITDAHLNLNGVGVGTPDSGFFVDESFAPDSSQTLSTFKSTFAGGTTKLTDSTIFNPPLTTLHVTKDIMAIASSASGQPARASVIDQSFSQTIVPEPTSLILALVGLIGFLGYRRNR